MTAMLTAADAGLEATRALRASKGRAAYVGERSIGHYDPGAASARLCLQRLQEWPFTIMRRQDRRDELCIDRDRFSLSGRRERLGGYGAPDGRSGGPCSLDRRGPERWSRH